MLCNLEDMDTNRELEKLVLQIGHQEFAIRVYQYQLMLQICRLILIRYQGNLH